jgi:hypothetical protein
MVNPLSNDLRKRIVDAKLRGDTEKKIAEGKEVRKCPKITLTSYDIFLQII